MPAEDLDAFLATAVEAARAAGEVIREGAGQRATLAIERKTVNDFVSIVDKRAERVIIGDARGDVIRRMRSRRRNRGRRERQAYTWLIDPLDGTTNFLHGFPHYCVSIALRIHDIVAVGVVFDPTSGRLFTATRGHGASSTASAFASPRAGPHGAMLGTGLPFKDWQYLDAYIGSLREIMQRCAGIRRPGAAALDLAYVFRRLGRRPLGARPQRLGRRRGHPCWSRKPAASSARSPAPSRSSRAATSSSARPASMRRCSTC